MKIAHVVQCYFPALGGSEALVRNVSECLANQYGDDVTVFTSANYNSESLWHGAWPVMDPGMERINGVTVRRFRVFSRLQWLRRVLAQGSRRLRLPYNDWLRTIQIGPIIWNLADEIAACDADVVFATAFPFLHMYYALAGARRSAKPIVFLGAIHFPDEWGYDRKMMYDAIRQADAYVAHTTYERDQLIQRGIQSKKIHVIGGGVHEQQFLAADGAGVREKYGWGDDPVIAVIARQSVLKRLDIMVRAMRAVWSQYPKARLLLAGARTSYSPQIDGMIQSLPAAQQARVTVVHDFGEEEKPRLLAACDIFAQPSVSHSFGIVFVEAWACGKPVIGADSGAIVALIEAGTDGLLFHYPHGESMSRAILELLDSPQRCRQMGEAGRQKVLERYTWRHVTGRLRAVYTEVLAADAEAGRASPGSMAMGNA